MNEPEVSDNNRKYRLRIDFEFEVGDDPEARLVAMRLVSGLNPGRFRDTVPYEINLHRIERGRHPIPVSMGGK